MLMDLFLSVGYGVLDPERGSLHNPKKDVLAFELSNALCYLDFTIYVPSGGEETPVRI